jgi:hypothetical protein
MSTITLSAAVSALKPGIPTSPEAATASWTVIKDFSDAMLPFMRTNYILSAATACFIGLSIMATLARARIPSIPTKPIKVTEQPPLE